MWKFKQKYIKSLKHSKTIQDTLNCWGKYEKRVSVLMFFAYEFETPVSSGASTGKPRVISLSQIAHVQGSCL